MAINEPIHIKGVLPPSFRAWYQLLNKVTKFPSEPGTPNPTILWTEGHPGKPQSYEFTLDEIKARVFDEMINGLDSILIAAGATNDPGQRQATLEELCKFISYRYFQKM